MPKIKQTLMDVQYSLHLIYSSSFIEDTRIYVGDKTCAMAHIRFVEAAGYIRYQELLRNYL